MYSWIISFCWFQCTVTCCCITSTVVYYVSILVILFDNLFLYESFIDALKFSLVYKLPTCFHFWFYYLYFNLQEILHKGAFWSYHIMLGVLTLWEIGTHRCTRTNLSGARLKRQPISKYNNYLNNLKCFKYVYPLCISGYHIFNFDLKYVSNFWNK